MSDTLTIKKKAITDRLKEKLGSGLVEGGRGTMLPQPADDIDPLIDFLARYDEGADAESHPGWEAQPPLEEANRYLSFDLGGEEYAASIMDIREILKTVSLTEVPRAPQGILGVLSKRGVVMPVVDLGAAIGLRAADPVMTSDQRILVVGDGDRVCGLRVDRVREVVRLLRHQIEAVPASLSSKNAAMLVGLGKAEDRLLILLDVRAVLDAVAVQAGLQPTGDATRRTEEGA